MWSQLWSHFDQKVLKQALHDQIDQCASPPPVQKFCTFGQKVALRGPRAHAWPKKLRSPIWSLTLVQISPWIMSHHFSVCHKSCLNAHCVWKSLFLGWFACGRAFGVEKIFMRGNGLSWQKSCYLKLLLNLVALFLKCACFKTFLEQHIYGHLVKNGQYACFKTFSVISLKLVT